MNTSKFATGAHSATLDFSKATSIATGQKIDFSKDNPGVTDIRIELHWDSDADADAAIVLLDETKKALKGLVDINDPNTTQGLVWYRNLAVPGIQHSGDARTTDGDPSSPEETINVDLTQLKTGVDSIVVVASTFPNEDDPQQKAVPFGKIRNCRVDIVDNKSNAVLYVYELDEDYSTFTSVELACFYMRNGEWRLTSMGDGVGTAAHALEDIAKKYELV